MKNGFIKAAAYIPELKLADVSSNVQQLLKLMKQADEKGVNLAVFPELCITGYTCGDLFFADLLLARAEDALLELAEASRGKYPVYIFGVPLRWNGRLYNCAAVIHNGSILGVVPKCNLPNYGEFYEKRQFTSGSDYTGPGWIELKKQNIPFGNDLLFCSEEMRDFCIGIELCEDLWSPDTPATGLCLAGATVVANLSASDELIGKDSYRRLLLAATSSRLICGYIYANAGIGESTQDMVFSGHSMVYEYGSCLAEAEPFHDREEICTELDIYRLRHERQLNTSFSSRKGPACRRIAFAQPLQETALTRSWPKQPFVPADAAELSARAEEILQIQSMGLMRRLKHIGCRTAVIGISGGLDSTLALLVAVRAADRMGMDRRNIVAVTMPCFGTTVRTRSNAEKLCELMGVSFRTVDITKAVLQHFSDIGQDPAVLDVTYENCQARERTQVIMDIANRENGIVIGTGDLSELALGWATYNGDHMSMYAVNASVPKTLVRYIVRYEAGNCEPELAAVLQDILDTPVSPELLPARDGQITQKTEDLVGPYELHDFFLYHMLRTGASPEKIFRLAVHTLGDQYDRTVILKWLRTFTRRFFIQQFKRSCIPDGPKVGTVTLSPRGDLRMPSDASYALWLEEIDQLA